MGENGLGARGNGFATWLFTPHAAWYQGCLIHGWVARATRMPKKLTMLNTIRGSLIDGFYPNGWDLERIDRCCQLGLKKVTTPARHWSREFKPVPVPDVAELDWRMGNAIAEAGPLDEKTQRLVKLAIAIGSGRQGAVNSHTRRAVTAGCTPEEVVHVGILAITTIGSLPQSLPCR